MDSPLGTLAVSTTEHGVRSLRALDNKSLPQTKGEPDQLVAAAIDAYFSGALRALTILPVDLSGKGSFATSVLAAMKEIIAGDFVTYGDLATRIGRPGSARAVGQAVGANPVTLVIPCHRVFAARKSLGGYSGGLWRKRWLLEHEGYLANAGYADRLAKI